jgi:ATP-dependent Zn protease
MATLRALAEALLEKEVLDSPEIDLIIKNNAPQVVPI